MKLSGIDLKVSNLTRSDDDESKSVSFIGVDQDVNVCISGDSTFMPDIDFNKKYKITITEI